MTSMLNTVLLNTASAIAIALPSLAFAQAAAQPAKRAEAESAPAAAADMSEGEVRKIDKENKKITLKHGEIRNLQMPGMTMVFGVKDAAVLDTLKVGDKVRFKAEKSGGALVVTDVQATH